MPPKEYSLDYPRTDFEPDHSYRIKGSVLNAIGKELIRLKQQVEDQEKESLQKEVQELRLRDRTPAVREAWDQYQTILNLARKDYRG